MFYYQKEFVKKKVSGEITFDVISLLHVQIEEPTRRPLEHLPFLQNCIITKYLKQEVDDNLSVCTDVTTTNRELPCRLLSWSCFYCLNLITTAPL